MDETNKKQMPRARRVHIGPEAYKRLNQVWSKLEERGAKDINRAELVEEAIDRLTDKYLDEYLQRKTPLEYLFEKQKDDPQFRNKMMKLLKK